MGTVVTVRDGSGPSSVLPEADPGIKRNVARTSAASDSGNSGSQVLAKTLFGGCIRPAVPFAPVLPSRIQLVHVDSVGGLDDAFLSHKGINR
jgi:hypothetical protein